MVKNKKLYVFALLGCLLLTGCQKEPEAEEQQGDEAGTWSEEEGTEEEKQEQYEKTVEQAARNLPEFFFRIKSYNGEEPVDSGQYIYVYNDDKSYASPISIALSMQIREEQYSEFARRTTRGAGIPSGFAYPVIYIEFFAISCSEEGTVSYEPTTLILASDGSFLLLKDGAFYSLRKDSIQHEIMSGYFEHLDNSREYVAMIEKSYDLVGNNLEEYEWRQLDLNGDGIDDLILQWADNGYWETQEILGIFACNKDSASCILWDTADMAEQGVYYIKYTEEGAEMLTQEELKTMYEMVTGLEFNSSFKIY